MDGYSVGSYDIRSLSTAIVTGADQVGEQLRLLRASEVTSADLGTEVGATYVGVVHGTLAESLAGFQSAGERLAELLTSTLDRIETVDEQARASFQRLGEEPR